MLTQKHHLFVHGVESAADDEAADFAGAGADLVQLGVPEDASGRVVCMALRLFNDYSGKNVKIYRADVDI